MKGIIFTNFMDLVEEKFGLEMVETLIEETQPPNEGAYTAVGTYDHTELVNMVLVLSEKSGIPVPDLIKAFGEFLFGELAKAHPHWLQGITSAFDLLERVDGFIHVEVRKLYPDAKPPTFECTRLDDQQMELIYASPRGLGDVAEGLILGCADYYNEEIAVEREKMGDGSGTTERFFLTMK